MIDTFIIPRKEAILALDLVSASLLDNVDEGIALSNTDTYLRIKTLYHFNSINSKFADLVLQSAKAEGLRQMFTRQPTHVRFQSTRSESESLLHHESTNE